MEESDEDDEDKAIEEEAHKHDLITEAVGLNVSTVRFIKSIYENGCTCVCMYVRAERFQPNLVCV